MYFVSGNQINVVAPAAAAGSTAVTVTNGAATSAPFAVTAQAYSPAFFLWPGGYAVATRQDFSFAVKNGTFSVATVAAKPGDVIILWGTGFGPTNPPSPEGVQVPASAFPVAATVTVTLTPVAGGAAVPVTVYGAALAPGFAALYQVAIQIPATLADGDYSVVASAANGQSPASAMITVQH